MMGITTFLGEMSSQAVWMGLDVVAKATVVLLLAVAVNRLLKGRVLARAAVWNALLVGLILLPAATALFPRLRICCLPPAPPEASVEVPAELPPPAETIVPDEVLPSLAEGEGPLPSFAATDLGEGPWPAEIRAAADPESVGPQDEPKIGVGDPSYSTADNTAELTANRRRWPSLIICTYLLGVAALALRLTLNLLAVRRLHGQSVLLKDPKWTAAMTEWRQRLGIRQPVQLGVSSAVNVPIQIGWLKPMVILPAEMIGGLDPSRHGSILLHELAHVRRRDYAWQILLKLAQIVYWPHPLIWLAGRMIGANREQVCDDLCVHHSSSAGQYRATLLEVASALVRRPAASLGIAMARTSTIGGRLERIDRGCRLSRCLARWPVRLTIVAVALVTACMIAPVELAHRDATRDASTLTEPPAAQPSVADTAPAAEIATTQPSIAETKPGPVTATEPAPLATLPPPARAVPIRSIDVTVSNLKTGQPIAGAKVTTFYDEQKPAWTTDVQGRCRVEVPDKPMYLTVAVEQAGLLGIHYYQDRTLSTPKSLVFRMEPGTSIGGSVQDADGKPVADATLEVLCTLPDEDATGIKLSKWYQKIKTGDQGRWTVDDLTSELTGLTLRFDRSPYLHREWSGGSLPPVEKLRDKTAVLKVERGIDVTGIVLDEQDKPIATLPIWDTKTDTEGRFKATGIWPSARGATIKAPGYLPCEIKNPILAGMPPLTIRLRKAMQVSGRVTDEVGKPLNKITVQAYATGPSIPSGARSALASTNEDGRFVLDGLQPGKWQVLTQSATYQMETRDIELVAGRPPEEVDFRVKPTVSLRGIVLGRDGTTPVANAEVWTWDIKNSTRSDEAGLFVLERLSRGGHELHVRAEGYAMVTQTVEIPDSPSPAVVRVTLDKTGASISGRAFDEGQGKPLSDEAIIALPVATLETMEYLGVSHFGLSHFLGTQSKPYWRTTTNDQGQYVLRNLGEGLYTVCLIGRSGNDNLKREAVRVTEGRTTSGVDLIRPGSKPSLVTGTVLDGTGQAVRDTRGSCTVTLRPGSRFVTHVDFRTNGQGRFSILEPMQVVKASTYDLAFRIEGYPDLTRSVKLDPVKPAVAVTLGLPAKPVDQRPGTVSGVVYMPDGKTPAAGLTVAPCAQGDSSFKHNQSSGGGKAEWFLDSRLQVITAADGTFTVTQVSPGRRGVLVRIDREWKPDLDDPKSIERAKLFPTFSSLVEVKPGGEARVNVVMKQGAVVTGTVKNAVTGSPIDQAAVYPWANPESLFLWRAEVKRIPFGALPTFAQCDARGRYVLFVLPPQRYDFQVGANETDGQHVKNVTLRVGEHRVIDFSLPPARYGAVQGRVLTPDGKSAANARVYIGNVSTPAATADEQGRYRAERLRAVENGAWSVLVKLPGFAPTWNKPIEVKPDKTIDLDLKLQIGGTVTGKVTQSDGRTPVSQAHVFLVQSPHHPTFEYKEALKKGHDDHERFWTHTEPDGSYRIEHVPPPALHREYQLFVVANDKVHNLIKPYKLKDGVIRKQDLKLSP